MITLPTDSISLDASAASDPDGTISDRLWKKISGPASFNVINSSCRKRPSFRRRNPGRCQHLVLEGSGTGVFGGVTGRLDFKDDVEAGNFPYRGQLRF